MGANTEMSRLDSIPTEKLNELLQMQGLPAATASDAGKVPVVNDDGAWELGAAGGGGTSALIVTDTDGTLNKTWQEIYDAMLSVGALYESNGGISSFVFAGSNGLGQYHVDTASGDEFLTDSTDGYPIVQL